VSERVFIDTNVFVYASLKPGDTLDKEEKRKRELAARLLQSEDYPDAWVSVTVAGELVNVLAGKYRQSPAVAVEQAAALLSFQSVGLDMQTVSEAMGLVAAGTLRIWDAIIFRQAKCAGCRTLLSEDWTSGFEVDGVVVRNPFERPAPEK